MTYGDVTPADLQELTSHVENLTIPPAEPMNTIFSEIDELAANNEIASAPITTTQKYKHTLLLYFRYGWLMII